jgi:hypothetical protein
MNQMIMLNLNKVNNYIEKLNKIYNCNKKIINFNLDIYFNNF